MLDHNSSHQTPRNCDVASTQCKLNTFIHLISGGHAQWVICGLNECQIFHANHHSLFAGRVRVLRPAASLPPDDIFETLAPLRLHVSVVWRAHVRYSLCYEPPCVTRWLFHALSRPIHPSRELVKTRFYTVTECQIQVIQATSGYWRTQILWERAIYVAT